MRRASRQNRCLASSPTYQNLCFAKAFPPKMMSCIFINIPKSLLCEGLLAKNDALHLHQHTNIIVLRRASYQKRCFAFSSIVVNSGFPRTSRGRAELDSDSDHWLSNSCFEPQLQGVPSFAARFCGCLRPFAFPLRTLSDVCGRLLALLALCWMSAAVCSPPSYFGGCLRPFARSPRTFADVCGRSFVLASRCATLATSRPPRPSRDWADSIAETDHWLSNSCFEPQLQGVPSFAARFCGCLRPFASRSEWSFC